MRPKDIQHAGKPQASVIPKAAMFLMRSEDRGQEDDADPTDGGQEGAIDPGTAGADDGAPTPPELAEALSQLVEQFGPDAVRTACEEATSQEQGELMDEAGDGPAAAPEDAGGDGDGGGPIPRY